MDTQKGFTPTLIVAVLLAATGFGGAWFLYTENQSLVAERTDLESKFADRDANLDTLKSEKARSEQELALLKASDIVKDIELLRLKLDNTEEGLAKVRGEIVPLETTMANIRRYADVVVAFDQNLVPPPPTPVNSNLKNIGITIGALNDSEVADQWGQAKSDIDAGGDGGADLIRAFFLVISKIRNLLP